MELDLGEGVNPLQNVVQQVIFEKNLQTKLEVTDTIINALGDKIKKECKADIFQKYLHTLFDDDNFMRKLEYISKIKDNVEIAVEYSGYDFLSSPDYHYDVEYEQKVVVIKKKLQKFLGSLLREFSKGEELVL